MREQMEKRLEELKSELAAGEKLLADLQAQQASVQQTMLRIAGAIQVLQELLGHETGEEARPLLPNGEETSHS
jgi:prefoldin subunit 5